SRGLVQLKLGAFAQAIADYGAAAAKNARDANSLYGGGIAKLRSGDAAGGEADISAAKAIKPDIANVYAGYGVKLELAKAGPAAPAPPPAPAAGCASAETHWKAADEIKTIAVYEDHLKRFPNCAFAMLARARIEALTQK